MKNKKEVEQHLIALRRIEVAKLHYRGTSVKDIADKINVDPRTVYYDIDYIEKHENEILSKFLVKTVPHILNKALSRLDQANTEAWSIIEKSSTHERDRIAALGVVGKTAKDMVDIVTNNKSVIDRALDELPELNEETDGDDNNELSGDEVTEQTEQDSEPIL